MQVKVSATFCKCSVIRIIINQKKNKMILKKVTRKSDHIYEIIYVSGIFKTHKSAKVYPWVGDWRFSETGRRLPYSLGTSLTTIAQGLKVGDSFYTKSSK